MHKTDHSKASPGALGLADGTFTVAFGPFMGPVNYLKVGGL